MHVHRALQAMPKCFVNLNGGVVVDTKRVVASL
jgi:hypothetical protein